MTNSFKIFFFLELSCGILIREFQDFVYNLVKVFEHSLNKIECYIIEVQK